MKKTLLSALSAVLLLACLPSLSYANQAALGYCETGARVVVTSGVSSSTRVMGSFPSCTVNVYNHGTLVHATIYSDNVDTPLANPFTASATGFWQFFADDGRYDIVLSAGGLPSPVTIYDYLLQDTPQAINTTSLMVSGTSTFNGGAIFNSSATFNGTMLDQNGRNIKVWYESGNIVNLQTSTWGTVLGSNTNYDTDIKLDVVGVIRAQQNPTGAITTGNGIYMFYRDADPFTTPLAAGNITAVATSGGSQLLRPLILSGSSVIMLTGATTNATLSLTMGLTTDHAVQYYPQATPPAVSGVGEAKMYFSSTTGFRCSVGGAVWTSCLVDQNNNPVGVGWTRTIESTKNRIYPTDTPDVTLLGATGWSGTVPATNTTTRQLIVGFSQSGEYNNRLLQLSNFSSSVNTGWMSLGTAQYQFSQFGASFGGGSFQAQGGSYLFFGTTSETNLMVLGEDVSQGGGTRGLGLGLGKRIPEARFDMNGKFWKRTDNNDIMKVEEVSEGLTLSVVSTTTDTVANLLPANAIILGVDVRVTTTIGTATNWSVGDASSATRFCSANSTMTSGTTSVCLNQMKGGVSTDATGPTQAAAAKVRITTTGTPSSGALRITVYYIQFSPATS